MTEITIVGLVALPLSLGTLFLFPRLLDDAMGWIPFKVNERSAALILVGYAWGVLLLTFRRSSEGIGLGRAILESLIAAGFSAMVTGAGVYVLNTFWASLPEGVRDK